MNATAAPAPLPLPGKRPDDDSVAGEEDPGASLEELVRPGPAPGAPPQPVPETGSGTQRSLAGG